jgi:hypothetical protein
VPTYAPQVALAIEKCLLVTTEVGLTPDPPPLPLLSALKPVNSCPPAAAKVGGGGLEPHPQGFSGSRV